MRTLLLIAVLATLCVPDAVSAQANAAPRLGVIRFPTSAGSAAQRAFEEGVLWMHSFEYPKAAAAFRRAQQVEPGFALAYWGEAMTHNHAVWNERNADSARAILGRLGATPAARAAKAPTAREKAWLHAVEVLWDEGPKPQRDTLYAAAMADVARDFPDDESKTFHALAILGLNQSVRDVAAYMRAGAIALDVFHRSPDHPGAAHYVIHAFDDPDHAILGLDAARAYSRIAPDAGHAQHMTTHIFLALGMWDDVARQNVVAMRAAMGNSDSLTWAPGHYTWWLNYARLQQGRRRDANLYLLQQFTTLPATAPRPRRQLLQVMADEAQVAIGLFDQVREDRRTETMHGPSTILAQGLAAWQTRNPGLLESEARKLAALAAAAPPGDVAHILAPQLAALLLQMRGNADSAIALLRDVARLEATQPMDFGPPAAIRPAHEALAEMLLVTGRYAEAQVAFDRALARTPGRSHTLAGLAVAARAAGDTAAANRAMTALQHNYRNADAGALDALLRDFRFQVSARRN